MRFAREIGEGPPPGGAHFEDAKRLGEAVDAELAARKEVKRIAP